MLFYCYVVPEFFLQAAVVKDQLLELLVARKLEEVTGLGKRYCKVQEVDRSSVAELWCIDNGY